MGDWPRLVNLRRCARGQIFDAGEATNTTVALLNDSTGAELILVWQLSQAAGGNGVVQTSYQQIKAMGTVAKSVNVVPSDAPPPGLISAGDQPTAFTNDWTMNIGDIGLGWLATFPFAVLLPGWSLVFQTPTMATGPIGVSFFWEAILPKYFDRMHTHYYLELALAQQGG